MNKTELITYVSENCGLSKSDATKAVEGVLGGISFALENKQEVRLIGFGTFYVSHRPAKEARNPRTGEIVNVAATHVAKFKPGKALKESVAA
jgi:DNA-binding protein HU-beta